MTPATARCATPIPAAAGIGLRAPHYRDALERGTAVPWYEAHSENYFGAGGAPHHYLERVRRDHPLSLHGVGLSLGSTDPLNERHLTRLAQLVERYQPGLVSEHLSWGSVGGVYLNDLLPLPYTEESLSHVVDRIEAMQHRLQRRILVENASTYLEYDYSAIAEWDFLAELAHRADCHILLDVNNIYVNSRNHGFDPLDFLAAMPSERIAEMHLAGHTENRFEDGSLLIDSHNRRVCDEVWHLYGKAVSRFPATPTLIEWDTDLPDFDVLLDERAKAQTYLDGSHVRVA